MLLEKAYKRDVKVNGKPQAPCFYIPIHPLGDDQIHLFSQSELGSGSKLLYSPDIGRHFCCTGNVSLGFRGAVSSQETIDGWQGRGGFTPCQQFCPQLRGKFQMNYYSAEAVSQKATSLF